MSTEFSDADEGKTVVSGDETVGRVAEVDQGTAYVDPDPSITDTVMSKLGWSDDESTESDTYPLSGDHVAEITDDEVRLEETL